MFATFKSLLQNPNLLKMCFVLFICNFGLMVVSPILPIYIGELGAPNERIATISGAIVAIAGLMSAAASAMDGRLHQRWNFRSILFVSCFCAGITFVGMAGSQNLSELFFFRALTGLFIGAMLLSANAVIALIVPEHQRGTAYGLTNSANLLGVVIGPLLGGIVTSLHSVHAVFWTSAAALILSAFWILRYIKVRNLAC